MVDAAVVDVEGVDEDEDAGAADGKASEDNEMAEVLNVSVTALGNEILRKTNEKLLGIEADRTLQVEGYGDMKLRTDDGYYMTLTGVLVTLGNKERTITDQQGRVILRAVRKHGLPVISRTTARSASGPR